MQHFNKIVNYIYQQYYESMAVKRLLNIERNSHGPTSDAICSMKLYPWEERMHNFRL